jgi:hypothetical protein
MGFYPPPVNRLLSIGAADYHCTPETWLNYPVEYQLGSTDIPALLRMANDHDLWELSPEEPRAWAPIHAVRALGQLKAVEAIDLLVDLDRRFPEDDWLSNSLPSVFGMLGPAALPALWASLDASDGDEPWRFGAIEALEAIAKLHPPTWPEIVAGLLKRLERFATQPEDLNGFLIDSLLELDAHEALPLMRQVYEAERVDPFCSTWHEVRLHFGLTEPDPLDKGPRQIRKSKPSGPSAAKPRDLKKAKRKATAKAKRKTRSRK